VASRWSAADQLKRYPTQDSSRPTCHDNRPKPIESVSEPSRNFSAHTNVRVARHVGHCVHRNVRPSVPKNLAARWRIVARTLDRLRCAVARRCVALPRIFTTRPDKVANLNNSTLTDLIRWLTKSSTHMRPPQGLMHKPTKSGVLTMENLSSPPGDCQRFVWMIRRTLRL